MPAVLVTGPTGMQTLYPSGGYKITAITIKPNCQATKHRQEQLVTFRDKAKC